MTRTVGNDTQEHGVLAPAGPATRRRVLGMGPSLAGVLAAGCGATTSAPEAGRPAKAPVTLEIIQDPQSRLVTETWPKIWHSFQATHPNVTVSGSLPPWGTIQDKVLTLAAGGGLPDVTYIHPQFLPDFNAAGVLRDLGPLTTKDKSVKLDDFFPGVLGFYQPKGITRGLPFFSGPAVFFYNKTLLAKYGIKDPNQYEKEGKWTWDTFLDVAKQATRGAGPEKTFGFNGAPSQLTWSAVFIWMNGGELWDKDETTFRMHEPAAAEALQWLADLTARHHVWPTADEVKEYPGGFLGGRTAFIANGKSYATDIKNQGDLNAGLCPMPKGAKGRVTRDGPGAVGVTSQTKNVDTAFELVKYMTGPGGQEPFLALGASVPVRKSMVNSKDYLASLFPWEDKAVHEDAARSVRPMLYPAGFGEIEKLWQTARSEAFAGKPARDALAAIKPAVDGILKSSKRS